MAIDADRFSSLRRLSDLASAPQAIGRHIGRLFERLQFHYRFTTLTGRIVVLNLVVLLVLVGSIFYFSKTEAWLIGAKSGSLKTQGEIIAAAIAANATMHTDRIVLDLDLLDPQGGSVVRRNQDDLAKLEFSIRPEQVAPILRRLVEPTGTRARIYANDGRLVLDSDLLFDGTYANQSKLVPRGVYERPKIRGLWTRLQAWFNRTDLPVYKDIGRANGKAYTEVRLALNGTATRLLLINEVGQHIVSVAIPIRGFSSVNGALLLSTRGGEIDQLLSAERWSIFRITLLALLAIVVSSVVLASTIGAPLHKLSEAAERVRHSLRRREELPDFTHRADEIGDLSGTLREMTDALYRRIEASERFAADVAHELKNPLTSVRSAAETLALVKTEEARQALAGTIKDDVRRLTRLIDDISNASRLDAELALSDAQPVDMFKLLETIVDMFNDSLIKDDQEIILHVVGPPSSAQQFIINGHDSRLGQVMRNLLDNALSFSPDDGKIWVTAERVGDDVVIHLDDQGPGIGTDNIEKIFARFYTDRPGAESFGNNSGLGLSISRDIVHAHGGTLRAENRSRPHPDEALERGGAACEGQQAQSGGGTVFGARFTIRLPTGNKSVQRSLRSGGRWR